MLVTGFVVPAILDGSSPFAVGLFGSFAAMFATIVGRDHLGATVNTLVFAYAGASLPLLLIFSSQVIALGDAINRELVATEIVAALVGSVGLILAVALTTITAALLAVRLPADVLPADDHWHHHH